MFEFSTKLGKKEVMELNKFHTYKKNPWLIGMFMFIFAALGVLQYFTAEDSSDRREAIIFILIFGLGFPLFVFLIMNFMVRLQIKSANFISDDNKAYYKFDNVGVYLKTEKPDMISTMEAKWNLVYKAFETKTHYFMYISNMQAYVIPKNDIISGTCEDFSQLLREKLQKKFKIK